MDALLSVLGLGPAALAFSVAAVLAGAFIKGYTGFGASMVWVTSLALVLPPLQVVPMVLLFEVVTSIGLLRHVWREVEWRSLWPLLAGTCARRRSGSTRSPPCLRTPCGSRWRWWCWSRRS
jgi:hypothetical protein